MPSDESVSVDDASIFVVDDAPIFVVDDEAVFREVANRVLARSGFAVECFSSAEAALSRLTTLQPAAILLDLELEGMSGHEALRIISRSHPKIAVIVVSAQESPRTIASVTQRGAFDYLIKPVEPKRLTTTVRHAVAHHAMAQRIAELERQTPSVGTQRLIGRSHLMIELRASIERVARTGVSVLIRGESGSGKELVARAIHASSDRARAPFVAINCAAIPKSLEEAELFGHERGAFTGATHRRIGKIEQAHGGTLLLDEIAELSAASQSKLLRVLQERVLNRVGGTEEVPVDFRLVAASHESLQEEVKRGRFREDLFYRIVVYEIDVPPLRARPGDIELLTDHFVRELGPELVGNTPLISPETLVVLRHYPWPGNVRELQNALQRGIVNCQGGIVLPSDLPSWIAARMPGHASSFPPARTTAPPDERPMLDRILPGMTLDEVEKRAIELAMARHGGAMTKIAEELGVARSTLYRKLRHHRIPRPPRD
jgi:DNA-binding NtrC family response regulator